MHEERGRCAECFVHVGATWRYLHVGGYWDLRESGGRIRQTFPRRPTTTASRGTRIHFCHRHALPRIDPRGGIIQASSREALDRRTPAMMPSWQRLGSSTSAHILLGRRRGCSCSNVEEWRCCWALHSSSRGRRGRAVDSRAPGRLRHQEQRMDRNALLMAAMMASA